MTIEEYNNKLDELRKQRELHREEINKIEREMDQLETDKKAIDLIVGEFIKVDHSSHGGYVEYMHVHSYEKRPRGVTLYGRGFTVNNHCISADKSMTLYWDDIDKIQTVTAGEFYAAFENNIMKFRNDLENFSEYEKKEDEFAFKDALREGKVKVKWVN
jgi:DNA mismatch repair ATPase MutS